MLRERLARLSPDDTRIRIFNIIAHFAVPAPQNSRRLTGNWREVAIDIHFHEKADGFDATSIYICVLLI